MNNPPLSPTPNKAGSTKVQTVSSRLMLENPVTGSVSENIFSGSKYLKLTKDGLVRKIGGTTIVSTTKAKIRF